MELITNIDKVRIPLEANQRTYYLPYSKRDVMPTTILRVRGDRMTIDDNPSYQGCVYLTLAATDGTFITKDYALDASWVDAPSQGALTIDRRIDVENSFVRILDEPNADEEVILLVVYSIKASAVRYNKILSLTLNTGGIEQRLSDYITGYQGSLLRIEYNPLIGELDTDAYIVLNDSTGRGITAPLEMFCDKNKAKPRVFNPYNFMPITPVWQNSFLLTPGEATLNFIFA